jgi:methylmalonyl-CoA/ethylmalonyl-CoA epimerase
MLSAAAVSALIARLDHVAIAVPHMPTVVDFIEGELGGQPCEGGPGPGFTGAQWMFDGGGRFEVLEPAGPPGFLHRFLDQRGSGIHHVTFLVRHLGEAVERAVGLGFAVIGRDESNPSWKEAFLHPKQALGIVVQLAESNPELGGGSWSSDFPFPKAAARAVDRARLIGVRLSVTNAERAHRQWCELLGGHVSSDGSLLVYRFAESPLRLAVQVDAARAEGPIALELDNAPPLPRGRHPELGCELVAI